MFYSFIKYIYFKYNFKFNFFNKMKIKKLNGGGGLRNFGILYVSFIFIFYFLLC